MKFYQEFSKILVVWLVLHSTVWMYCSYYLAYLGRNQIAETLSERVVVELLGVLLVYAVKSLFENLSKNNCWPDKPNNPDKSEA